MILQALVDDNYMFTDIYMYIGWPGSVHDASVLANSAVHKRANDSGRLLNCEWSGLSLSI